MPDFDFLSSLTLENERVLLRPLRAEDHALLLSVACEDESLLRYGSRHIHTPELLEVYIADALSNREKEMRYPFIVFDKATANYAGSTSFYGISNHDRRLEIGYTWYGRAFQRSGLNRYTKLLLLSYAFGELGFERVEFKIDERNAASRKAVERLGATQEGILRSHMVLPDGFRRNTVYYSILKSEWPAIQAQFPIF